MKIRIELSGNEIKAIKGFMKHVGAEKYDYMIDNDIEYSYGPIYAKSNVWPDTNASCDINIREDLFTLVIDKFKKVAGLLKSMVKVFMDMSDCADKLFESSKPGFLIDGEDGHEYLARKIIEEEEAE